MELPLSTSTLCYAKIPSALENAESQVINRAVFPSLDPSEIVIDQKTTVVVGLEPMVEVHLIEV
jgi:hypothetical protein